ALNVRTNSVEMKLLDQLMIESGLVFPIFARPITQREWYTYVTAALSDPNLTLSPSLRRRISKYIPNFKYRDRWHTEAFMRVGLESIYRDDDDVPYITRYEDRLPLARYSYQASRDTAFGFSIQLKLQNYWAVYTTTQNRTNLTVDPRADLDFRVFHKAYFSYQTPRITFQFGRDNLSWGVGERASTILSTNVPYYDYIKFVLWFTKIKFSMAYVSLVDYEPQGGITDPAKIGLFDKPQRNMMLQRVEWNILPQLSIGTTYMKIIFGRMPKLDDINPFIWQHNLFKDYQNSLMSVDMVLGIIPGLQWYAELTSDEIQSSSDAAYDNPNGPTTVSYQFGLNGRAYGFSANAEYVYIAPYMYNFLFAAGRAVDFDGIDYPVTKGRDILTRALGHWLPPDSRNVYASLEYEVSDEGTIKGIGERRLNGAISLATPYPQGNVSIPASPSGIVETTDILGLTWSYVSATFEYRAALYSYTITNFNNIQSDRKNGLEARASIGYRVF
ncbi:MAG: capsule assembly Wzi family protein, partial [Bacteroidota bacterium]